MDTEQEKTFLELKKLLEGKKIRSIDHANAPDGICKFTIDDGSTFCLHATELGYWLVYTSDSKGRYRSFDALASDYSNYIYDIYGFGKVPVCKISRSKNDYSIIEIEINNKIFELSVDHLNDWEMLVINHQKGLSLLKRAIRGGDIGWRLNFSSRNIKCPPELYHPDMLNIDEEYNV